ncbi:hypothetical protein WC3_02395 [Escherichia coli KTE35]|nr:hypothetical protein WC3_02395 [Escherichia coli KTE35]EOV01454.1 hypothetical protein WEY_00002 [Escherichia coli KTE34]
MDPEQGECYLSGRILLMKIEELREIFSEDGLGDAANLLI